MSLGKAAEAGAEGLHRLLAFFDIEGLGFVGEEFENAIAEDVSVTADFIDGGEAFEADDDFGPGKETFLAFELVELFPDGEAGFLNHFIDEMPGGQDGT